jgi:hypothetical protein
VLPLGYVDGCRGIVSLRVAFDHTPDVGGVVALCGLGPALPLDSVIGTVPLFLDTVDRDSRLHRRCSLF